MKLQQLAIRQFRNITRGDMTGLADVNFIHGLNGSGKTSVLEAIHTLSITRSFRSRKIRSVIQQDCDDLVVRGKLVSSLPSAGLGASEGDGVWLAVQRSKTTGARVKFHQEKLASIGELAGILPVQVINPDSFSLVEGSPSHRRQFLDWSVFHVKHLGFYDAWLRYRKALQQRNSLLRRGKISAEVVAPWDAELTVAGELINACRDQQFLLLKDAFQAIYHRLANNGQQGVEQRAQDYPILEMRFSPGWEEAKSLAQMLQDNFDGDVRQGFTRAGPHRADIDIRSDGAPAAERLSRGQIKTLVCAMKIAQCAVLSRDEGLVTTVLIDDLPAELDVHRRAALFAELSSLDAQVFATAIESQDLLDEWCKGRSTARFHVEHGDLRSL